MIDVIAKGILIGTGATVLLDLWSFGMAWFFRDPQPDFRMMGRWFAHLREGKVFHADIAAAAPHPQENAIGWAGHFAVGIAYGIVLALACGREWLAAPTLFPALAWGVLTIAAGWFLLLPGMGLGMAGSALPDPGKARATGLLAHVVFGLGLWLTALYLA